MRRYPQLILGLLVMATGITAIKQSDLGLGPWDVLHDGIAGRTGSDLGIIGLLVGIPIMLLWLPLRERPGLGTILNVVVIGVAIHVLLDHTSEADAGLSDSELTPHSLREVEAEAVALVCLEALALPGADHCRGYIQVWNQQLGAEPIPERSAQRIFKAADQILKAGVVGTEAAS